MEKRLLLAFALSCGVFVVWSILFPAPTPQRPTALLEPVGMPTAVASVSSPAPTPLAEEIPQADPTAEPVPTEVHPDLPEGPRVTIGNDKMELTFSSPSGLLTSIKLLQFPEKGMDLTGLKRRIVKTPSPERERLQSLLVFAEERQARLEGLQARLKDSSGEDQVRLEQEIMREEAFEMVPKEVFPEIGLPLALREIKAGYLRGMEVQKRSDREVAVLYDAGLGLTFTASLKLGDGYLAQMDLSWQNATAQPMTWSDPRGYQIEWGGDVGLYQPRDSTGGRFNGPASRMDYKFDKKPLASLVKEVKKGGGMPIVQHGVVQWIAMRSKYFMVAFVPETPAVGIQYVAQQDRGAGVGLLMPSIKVGPGETVRHTIQLYLGPKDYDLVRKQSFQQERLGLERAVDLSYYPLFEDLSLIILRALEWFQRLTHDYGIAIILLTIVVKVLFFPLTFKSITSMRKTQELQPILVQMRQQYKNNPKLLQQEMSKLYRKHKVNPVSGCLPMLFQMPVFITLFGTLSTSIRLRGAPFLNTWVHDLSSPDTVGHLPDAFPLVGGLPINILPIFMVIGMFVQQKLTTPMAVTDEQIQQQKMMTIFMPIFFSFICYNMPSGLVLYWICQSALSMVEQTVVKKMRPLKVIQPEPAKKGSKKS